MNLNEKALQVLLNSCDNMEHIGGRLYRFTFDDAFVDTVIVAQKRDRGWRVVSVSND